MSNSAIESRDKALHQRDFLAFLKGLHLRAMRLRGLKVKADREFRHNEMRTLQHSERHSFVQADDGSLRIDVEHVFRLIGARKKVLGSITATFSWYYANAKPIDDRIYESFAPMVKHQTWPHARELVQDVALRANWPRLTLPLLVVHGTGEGSTAEQDVPKNGTDTEDGDPSDADDGA